VSVPRKTDVYSSDEHPDCILMSVCWLVLCLYIKAPMAESVALPSGCCVVKFELME